MVKKEDGDEDRSGKEAVIEIDTQQQAELGPETRKTINFGMCIGLVLHWYDVFSDFQYQFTVPFSNGHLQRAQLAFIIFPLVFLALRPACSCCCSNKMD